MHLWLFPCPCAICFSVMDKVWDVPLSIFAWFKIAYGLVTLSRTSYCTFLIASAVWGMLLEAPCRACLRVSGTERLTTAETCQVIVMLKQPLHSSHWSTSAEPGLESYRLGAHGFPKASWSWDNRCSAVKSIDNLWMKGILGTQGLTRMPSWYARLTVRYVVHFWHYHVILYCTDPFNLSSPHPLGTGKPTQIAWIFLWTTPPCQGWIAINQQVLE